MGSFSWHSLDPHVPFEDIITANQYKVTLSDQFYPVIILMGVVSLDNSAHVSGVLGVTEWFDEYEKDVNHLL